VYCSSSLSLAQLEQLAHLNGPSPPTGFEWLEIGIPKRCFNNRRRLSLADLGQYGFDWKSDPPHMMLQEIGTEWVNSGESLVMEVPSVVNPIESNFLINPLHPEFDKIRLKPAAPLEWDRRLLECGE
jgi:RES domain-containing protein